MSIVVVIDCQFAKPDTKSVCYAHVLILFVTFVIEETNLLLIVVVVDIKLEKGPSEGSAGRGVRQRARRPA